MFAIVGTVGADDVDILEAVIFDECTHGFADVLAAALLTLFTSADIENSRWCVLFFRHSKGSAAFEFRRNEKLVCRGKVVVRVKRTPIAGVERV